MTGLMGLVANSLKGPSRSKRDKWLPIACASRTTLRQQYRETIEWKKVNGILGEPTECSRDSDSTLVRIVSWLFWGHFWPPLKSATRPLSHWFKPKTKPPYNDSSTLTEILKPFIALSNYRFEQLQNVLNTKVIVVISQQQQHSWKEPKLKEYQITAKLVLLKWFLTQLKSYSRL